jgi:hypothetical protein
LQEEYLITGYRGQEGLWNAPLGFCEKYGVFGKPIETAADLAEASVKIACILHSFIMKEQIKIDRLMEEELIGKSQGLTMDHFRLQPVGASNDRSFTGLK